MSAGLQKEKPAPMVFGTGSEIDNVGTSNDNQEPNPVGLLLQASPPHAPASMPQPSNVAALDLFDATRISGRGPAVCLALISRYRLGTLIHTAEGRVLRIHANRFRAAAIAEWGRRDGS